MTRSSWKAPYIKLKLEQQTLTESNKRLPFKSQIITYDRSATITPEMLGHILVHNGHRFVGLNITENHVGFKLGQFAMTKKRVRHKQKRSYTV